METSLQSKDRAQHRILILDAQSQFLIRIALDVHLHCILGKIKLEIIHYLHHGMDPGQNRHSNFQIIKQKGADEM